MDEHIHPDINESILLDYLTGTLPATGRKAVEEWLRLSEENRKIARDIEYIYQASDTIRTIQEVNSTDALKQVKKRIHKSGNKIFLVWFQRIAAILLLPLLITTIYYSMRQEPIEYLEIKTNPGMVATVKLPDGSTVWLNSRSYLKYPQAFTGRSRDVELDGEAYFSVYKDKSKKFIVSTPFNLKAEVLGTEFNMEAYKESNQIITTLISGSVRLAFRNHENKEQSLIMQPNDEISYNRKTGNIQLSTPYIPSLTAWKDGLVIFRNTSFEEALKILSKRFNADFVIKNDLLYENSFTGTFDGQHLSLILEHFRLSSDIQYKYVSPKADKDTISQKTIIELY